MYRFFQLPFLDVCVSSISVIIPSYNRADILSHAVDSVLAQTLPASEILIVDDGSTDSTVEKFCRMPAPVRLISKANGGVSSARNAGVAQARGEWLAFLDSDDTWHPQKLERQLAALAAEKTDICYCGISSDGGARYDGMEALDPGLSPGGVRSYSQAVEFMTRSDHHPMVQTLLIRKSLLLQCGAFDESLWVAEDTALFYQLVAAHKVTFINESLATIARRNHRAGLSNAAEPDRVHRRIDCSIQVQLRGLALLGASNLDTLQKMVALGVFRRRLAYFLSRKSELLHCDGEPALARQTAREARALSGDIKTTLRACLLASGFRPYLALLQKKWSAPAPQ